MAARRRVDSASLPSKDELVRYLAGSQRRPPTNELLQAFGLKPAARTGLRDLLRELEAEGQIAPRRVRRVSPTTGRPTLAKLPAVTVVEVASVDDHGDLICRSEREPQARIVLPIESVRQRAPGKGDRLLVRLRGRRGGYEAELLKALPRPLREAVGVLEAGPGELRLRSMDRAAKTELRIRPEDADGAEPGELVRVRVASERPLALPRARVVERLGRFDDARAISLGVAARLDLPMAFPPDALALADQARPVSLGDRRDLRDLPLVTIDGEDARDFDDAVWAAPDSAKGNPDGWRIVVAIADVAHYVRPGDALDRAAKERGNSVYFPDRVIPMLPEALSNDLCSLRPDEDRACVAAEMRIDANGNLIEQRFRRALMRSRARLTYTQVQAARDGQPDTTTAPLLASVIEPLFDAYEVLAAARQRRGAIDLDLPERRVLFDGDGQVAAIVKRERASSHMVIEELMILANVAAATVLEQAVQPTLYRVHDKPDPLKLAVLADYLERIGVPWTRTSKQPGDFTALLERLQDHALKEAIAGFILRSQAQAVYSPRNIGHFGLNLRRYAHFTSPIRRYSDLVVHRALIRVLGLGPDGLGDVSIDDMVELGAHLSKMERRAIEAERGALERFTALFMTQQVGARFSAKITGVQRFGAFITLEESGAEGLLPVSQLGAELYLHDEHHHALVGQRSGETFGLGDRVTVELIEADPVTGGLVFRLETHEPAAGAELARAARRKGGRPTGRTVRGRTRRRS